MKILNLFIKSVKEQLREPLMLAVTVSFGAIFMLIFGLALGENYYTYKLAINNHDKPVAGIDAGDRFIKKLKEVSYQDGVKMFEVEMVDSAKDVESRLQKRDISAFIEIPETFSGLVYKTANGKLPADNPRVDSQTSKNKQNARNSIKIVGDPANASFSMVRMMSGSVLDGFLAETTGYTAPVSLGTTFIEAKVKGGGEFTYIAPGIMLMAIFLLMIQCAMVIVKEVQNGTILRLRISHMKIWEFLTGISASQVFFAAIMLPLMYAVAVLVGFKSSGSLSLAFLVGICASIVAIAFGLIIAAISRTVIEAFLWGNLATIPVVFLAGCFFPMPEHVLFTISGAKITLMDWLPSYPAVTAINKVFLYGANLQDVAGDMLKMLLMTSLLFAFGVFLFSRTHLKKL